MPAHHDVFSIRKWWAGTRSASRWSHPGLRECDQLGKRCFIPDLFLLAMRPSRPRWACPSGARDWPLERGPTASSRSCRFPRGARRPARRAGRGHRAEIGRNATICGYGRGSCQSFAPLGQAQRGREMILYSNVNFWNNSRTTSKVVDPVKFNPFAQASPTLRACGLQPYTISEIDH